MANNDDDAIQGEFVDDSTGGEMATSAIEAITRGEIDVAIATARRFPRNLKSFLQNAIATVTMSQEIAEGCSYYLERTDNRTKEKKSIEGASIRLAEIVVPLYQHVRWIGRVLGSDDKQVYAQGIFFDVQNNVMVQEEVGRRITGRSGQRYGDDMVGVTAAAAKSIAMRNAALRGMPKHLLEEVRIAAKKFAMGDATTVSARWAKAVSFFKMLGVTEAQILAKLEHEKVEEVTPEDIGRLQGLRVALKEGMTNVWEEFPAPEAAATGDAGLQEAPTAGTSTPMTSSDKVAASIEGQKHRGRPPGSKNTPKSDKVADSSAPAATTPKKADDKPPKLSAVPPPADDPTSARAKQLRHADLIARLRTAAAAGGLDNGPAIDDAIRGASDGRFADFNAARVSVDDEALDKCVVAMEEFARVASQGKEEEVAEEEEESHAEEREDDSNEALREDPDWVNTAMRGPLPVHKQPAVEEELQRMYLRVLKGCQVLSLSLSDAEDAFRNGTGGVASTLAELRVVTGQQLKDVHRYLMNLELS